MLSTKIGEVSIEARAVGESLEIFEPLNVYLGIDSYLYV